METTFYKSLAKKFSWKRFAFRSAVKNMLDERNKEFQDAEMPFICPKCAYNKCDSERNCEWCQTNEDYIAKEGLAF